jgi:hypothetical protein
MNNIYLLKIDDDMISQYIYLVCHSRFRVNDMFYYISSILINIFQ